MTKRFSDEQITGSLTQARCDAIALFLNTRPRKRYGFRTPQQRVKKLSGVLHLSC